MRRITEFYIILGFESFYILCFLHSAGQSSKSRKHHSGKRGKIVVKCWLRSSKGTPAGGSLSARVGGGLALAFTFGDDAISWTRWGLHLARRVGHKIGHGLIAHPVKFVGVGR
jgi:hypothetical protein